MKFLHALAAFSLLACSLATAPALANEDYKGNWTLSPTNESGMVHFALMRRWNGNHSNHENDWPASALQGLDLKTPGKRDVSFVITRDAGRFDCEGYLKNGEGAGVFRFTPNARFRDDLTALGFTGVDDEMQFAMATTDVTIDFARQMKALKLDGMKTDHLIAMRIFNVTPAFVRDMRTEGLPLVEVGPVIAFRVHQVTLELVRQFRQRGFEVTEDQLLAFRVHGVTPEYVAKIESLGYDKPSAEQLVAMRVHGVTPEFIAEMQSRGLKDLTIDKLVGLRVHGID